MMFQRVDAMTDFGTLHIVALLSEHYYTR